MKKATFSGSFSIKQLVLQSKANFSTYNPLKNSSLVNQYILIKLVLSHGKSITVEWGMKHGIDYLPARIKELKDAGVHIGTEYAPDIDENGIWHKKRAFYYLNKFVLNNNDVQLAFDFE